MNIGDKIRQATAKTATSGGRLFDLTSEWLTKLSWWKFVLFAVLVFAAGKIMQDGLLSSSDTPTEMVVTQTKKPAQHTNIMQGWNGIRIDGDGIQVKRDENDANDNNDNNNKNDDKDDDNEHKDNNARGKHDPKDDHDAGNASNARTAADVKNAAAVRDAVAAAISLARTVAVAAGAKAEAELAKAEAAQAKADARAARNAAAMDPDAAVPAPPAPPAKAMMAPSAPRADLNTETAPIALPPEIGEQVSDAIVEAVDNAAEKKVIHYRKQTSEWVMNFVLLLLIGLFGMKALMGGKKRAEADAVNAHETAERESMQRQVSEAKMQLMQAQVEPHFLFNTLASVEHLIETDPPRASAMQRSLIKYLRAVLPQMRETATVTNLGREADIVKAYLDLLKMRMEERLQVQCEIPDGLRSAAFPPMMLQSLVENAIKHGLECKPEGGTLRIAAEVAHNKLQVSVTDDGVGFGVMPSDGTGLGLQSIRDRLKLLHGEQSQLTISPNTPSGVCSTITVPYQLANVAGTSN